MSEKEDHLSPQQIEWLSEGQLPDRDEHESDQLVAARRHVEGCAHCHKLVTMHERASFHLRSLKSSVSGLRTGLCPEESVLRELACGLLSPDQSDEILGHVIRCDYCGPIYREALVDFNEPPTNEERDLMARLKTARPNYQANLGRRLAREANKGTSLVWARWNDFQGIFVRMAAIAAVVLLVWFVARTYLRTQPDFAERLLAKAYSVQRTLEPRIPGADFAPMRIERGADRSRVERPTELLEAEAIISEKLARHPDDFRWLQEKARADLLDGNYSAALDTLQRALELQPDEPSLQVDLATAYFQRAETEGRVVDYTTSIDLLGKALQKQPDNVVALFNRGLSLERMFLYAEAIEDWEHYLKVDVKGNWSREATRRLQLLKQSQLKQDQSYLQPLLAPDQLMARVAVQDEATWSVVDQRIEEYQKAALRDWLPAAVSVRAGGSNPRVYDASRRAVEIVALIQRIRHNDTWLHELLESASSSTFPAAITALREAIIAGEHADYERALEEASRARRLFIGIDNFAGASRAEFERVFALHFSNNGLDCAREAARLAQSQSSRTHPWILAQTEIEEGICRNLVGDFGLADSALAWAVSVARENAYPVTSLRALTMRALVQWSAGNNDSAWQGLYEGAAACWTSGCPRMTLYSLYANMDNFAEYSREWQLQMTVAKQATVAIGSDPDHLMRAVEHSRLAKAAALAGAPSVAQENFRLAGELLETAPHTDITRHYQAGIKVDLAKLAIEKGDRILASQYLAEVQPQLSSISDHYILLDYFSSSARLNLDAGQLAEGDTSLRWAVGIAERELTSLGTERDRVAWSAQSAGIYRDWMALELARGRQERALDAWELFLGAAIRSGGSALARASEQESDPFTLSRKGGAPPPFPEPGTVEAILPSLRRESVISYSVVSGKVAVWVFDDRGISFSWLPASAPEILQTARRFTRACANRDSDGKLLRIDGRRLYDELVGPIQLHLDSARTLLFEGDQEISDIPLDALVDGAGKYLGDTYRIVGLPGAVYLQSLRSNIALSSLHRALLVAVPSPGNRTGFLPVVDSAEEARLIAGQFHDPKLVLGNQATTEILEREMPGAVVFHYAGHTSSGAQAKGLMLVGESDEHPIEVLDASRVRSLRPALLQLAVLSGCSTEGGPYPGSRSPDRLPAAFLQSGVPHVLASRWNVDSATTVKLMKAFYEELFKGKQVSEALREAEVAIRSTPGTDKPYYWAAFHAFGRA